MPDLPTSEVAMSAGSGALSGGIAALLKVVSTRQTVASILGGILLGPVAAICWHEWSPMPKWGGIVAGAAAGLVALSAIPLIQGAILGRIEKVAKPEEPK
jgi:hypothetical protein